ncbi:Choline-sulfatase [Pontiella desulfatans]|uniref:Choline-sulfatase n=1 Tax=Pontiella desulfatans TaxID=2750659 RepID=A0A6C2UAE2_PONDE|nr:sulfatase-like hydrolase/transferase [Pontiella desulfatans]SPS74075.1 sulfatase S1_23 [Kiritimatiellales bacterium]VGO17010.1 Choline-sulfatase [Pontiella desulfatans]
MNRRSCLKSAVAFAAVPALAQATAKPRHIVLVMSDDQGWGQTGYNNHPLLKTPNLDAMAASGLRFDRFYAGGPVCSPTRATVLTGRTHDRTGVYSHGHPLRHQEKTLPQALKAAGYATGHFGKWHLNGLRGPGAPVLGSDSHHPGTFGFDEWLTVTNFFDMNPIMSRKGTFEEFKGDSSEVIVAEALKFIEQQNADGKPSFAVIWYGSPHSPFIATDGDSKAFESLDAKGKQHHGELVAMDRSVGTLRSGLRKMGLSDETLVWFSSDNGGLGGVGCDSVGGLRGKKGTVYEGGLRVPGIIEWPVGIKPRITKYPAGAVDMFPTLVELLGLPRQSMGGPIDGESLVPLFGQEPGLRKKPLPFQFGDNTLLIDNDHKIIFNRKKNRFELYDLKTDPKETTDILGGQPEIAARLKKQVVALAESIAKSDAGADYPEGKVVGPDPGRRFWVEDPAYEPYLDALLKRPEYQGQSGKAKKKK